MVLIGLARKSFCQCLMRLDCLSEDLLPPQLSFERKAAHQSWVRYNQKREVCVDKGCIRPGRYRRLERFPFMLDRTRMM